MKQNIAVITGASEGIGAALTKLLIKHNWKVIGLSRNLEKLKLMQNSLFQKKDYLKIYACDVQDFSKLKSIAKKNSPADLLFLNAGIYNPIDASQNNIEVYKQHLNINYLGVINSYEAFLPKMITTKKGHIIIMSSITAWIGLPKAAAYGPTKAALRSFAQSIRYDLNSKGVKVQVCSPGFVDTPATAKNDFYMPGLMKADDAAKIIYNRMKSNKFEISFPLNFSIFMKIFSMLPDKLTSLLIKKFVC